MKPLTGIPVYEPVKYEMLHSQNMSWDLGYGIFFKHLFFLSFSFVLI